jgi:hypothetical protein
VLTALSGWVDSLVMGGFRTYAQAAISSRAYPG